MPYRAAVTLAETTDRVAGGSTADDQEFSCVDCGSAFEAGTDRPTCPVCGSMDVAALDPADGRREISASPWTFVGVSVLFIVATSLILYAGIVVYAFLLG